MKRFFTSARLRGGVGLTEVIATLKRYAPEEYYLYERTKNRHNFAIWLSTGGPAHGLPMAVHETLHLYDLDNSEYSTHTLSVDEHLDRTMPRFRDFFRSELAPLLPADQQDGYCDAYLKGACGQQGLEMLLEELNAYTHGCRAAVRLRHLYPRMRAYSERDGLATFMLYHLLYLKYAHGTHPITWQRLVHTEGLAKTFELLWVRAEQVMAEALPYKELGIHDDVKRRHIANERHWLDRFFRDAGHCALPSPAPPAPRPAPEPSPAPAPGSLDAVRVELHPEGAPGHLAFHEDSAVGRKVLGLVPASRFVAREQFRLEKCSGGWFILGARGTTNGTYLNGDSVDGGRQPLSTGDEVFIGNIKTGTGLRMRVELVYR